MKLRFDAKPGYYTLAAWATALGLVMFGASRRGMAARVARRVAKRPRGVRL